MLRHLCDEDTNVFPEKKFQPAVRKLATDLLLSGKAAGKRCHQGSSIAAITISVTSCVSITPNTAQN